MIDSDLLAALEPVVQALEELGVRYYVGGSVAGSVHGASYLDHWAEELGVRDLLQRARAEVGAE